MLDIYYMKRAALGPMCLFLHLYSALLEQLFFLCLVPQIELFEFFSLFQLLKVLKILFII